MDDIILKVDDIIRLKDGREYLIDHIDTFRYTKDDNETITIKIFAKKTRETEETCPEIPVAKILKEKS